MKHTLSFFLMGAGLALAFSACQNKAALEQQRIADSLAVVNEQWSQDSLRIVNHVTPDLTFAEVHGPVQTVNGESQSYTFSKEGEMLTYNGYNPFKVNVYDSPDAGRYHFVRKNGHVAFVEGWESGSEYVWERGRIQRRESGAEGEIYKYTYNYDGAGNLTGISYAGGFDGAVTDRGCDNYSYEAFDQYGNWTIRSVNGRSESRSITYFPIVRPSAAQMADFNPLAAHYHFVGVLGEDLSATLVIDPKKSHYITFSSQRKCTVTQYDQASGSLTLEAKYDSGKFLGQFVGNYNKENGHYMGMFTNYNGGSIQFDFKLCL